VDLEKEGTVLPYERDSVKEEQKRKKDTNNVNEGPPVSIISASKTPTQRVTRLRTKEERMNNGTSSNIRAASEDASNSSSRSTNRRVKLVEPAIAERERRKTGAELKEERDIKLLFSKKSPLVSIDLKVVISTIYAHPTISHNLHNDNRLRFLYGSKLCLLTINKM
jgi:hypothetical protein